MAGRSTYDATGDAVGRALYNNDTTQFYTDSPTTAVVLRAGQNARRRPGRVYRRNPCAHRRLGGRRRVPRCCQPSRSSTHGRRGFLRPVPARRPACVTATQPVAVASTSTGMGTDSLQIAKKFSGSNDTVQLTALQLAHIYQCDPGYTTWNGSGIGGTSTETIIPIIPQSGSGTRNDFISSLTAAPGQHAVNINTTTCVQTAQEHDPAGITAAHVFGGTTLAPQDAIEPFSLARVNLINAGYFANANVAANQVSLVTGGSAYNLTRGMYFNVRHVDQQSLTKWQPGRTPELGERNFRPGWLHGERVRWRCGHHRRRLRLQLQGLWLGQRQRLLTKHSGRLSPAAYLGRRQATGLAHRSLQSREAEIQNRPEGDNQMKLYPKRALAGASALVIAGGLALAGAGSALAAGPRRGSPTRTHRVSSHSLTRTAFRSRAATLATRRSRTSLSVRRQDAPATRRQCCSTTFLSRALTR